MPAPASNEPARRQRPQRRGGNLSEETRQVRVGRAGRPQRGVEARASRPSRPRDALPAHRSSSRDVPRHGDEVREPRGSTGHGRAFVSRVGGQSEARPRTSGAIGLGAGRPAPEPGTTAVPSFIKSATRTFSMTRYYPKSGSAAMTDPRNVTPNRVTFDLGSDRWTDGAVVYPRRSPPPCARARATPQCRDGGDRRRSNARGERHDVPSTCQVLREQVRVTGGFSGESCAAFELATHLPDAEPFRSPEKRSRARRRSTASSRSRCRG